MCISLHMSEVNTYPYSFISGIFELFLSKATQFFTAIGCVANQKNLIYLINIFNEKLLNSPFFNSALISY